nr:MAG TPA_asm: hypothetical protein [Caudoviricetes sp.]
MVSAIDFSFLERNSLFHLLSHFEIETRECSNCKVCSFV